MAAPMTTAISRVPLHTVDLANSIPSQSMLSPSAVDTPIVPSHAVAIAGGIAGGLLGLALLLVLLHHRYQKRTAHPDVELARGHQGRSTEEILNAVAKRAAARQERARRRSQSEK